MKILSPFSRQEEVAALCGAGADELYCGVVPPEWEKRFTYTGSVNLRHDKAANLSSFKQLALSCKTAKKYDIPVFVAFNSHFYSQQQLPLVLQQIRKALAAGTDRLIIADPGLIQIARKKFPDAKISLSTGQPCFNASSLQFFKQLGVSRIVLPRHLTASEAASLAAKAKRLGVESECFVLNAICPFIDGLCTFQHIVEPSQQLPVQELACRARYAINVQGKMPREKKRIAAAHVGIWNSTFSEDCGLCALPPFQKAKVDCVKIAGRANSLEKKLGDIAAVREAIALAKKMPKKRFAAGASRLYFQLYKRLCQCKNCYYPHAGRWKQ